MIIYLGGTKYGLWENGKRIKWFTEEEINKIKEQTLDYVDFFELTKSRTEVPRGSFEPPESFEKMTSMIYKEFVELNE